MDTYFAPAPRTERRKFQNQLYDISHNPVMDTLLKTAAGLLIVLNEDRQIVAMNHAFLEELGVEDPEKMLGLRLGESLNCVHAHEKPFGCGTTESCLSCGAAIAMMAAITEDHPDEQICALLKDESGQITHTCLLIKANPIQLGQHRWILIYAQDITQHHYLVNLERIFFHDINNILTALSGNAQLLDMDLPGNREVAALKTGINRIIREVDMQKLFSRHKQSGKIVIKQKINLSEIRQETRMIFMGHPALENKRLVEEWPDKDLTLRTDPILVSRILGNMVINALEASEPGGVIRLTAVSGPDHITWEAWNRGWIPGPVQKRVFQRHFSTKPGVGRGMGTYSMKLFGEKYLNGRVWFTSSERDGTVFFFRLFH